MDPGAVVLPSAAGRAGTALDSAPYAAFSASVVFHEPMYKPTRPPAREHEPSPPATPPPPEPAPAEVSGVVDPQPAAPSGVQEEGTAAPPETPRRSPVIPTVITVTVGLLGVVLAYVLASGSPRKEPSKPAPAPAPSPPSAAVPTPSVVPPTAPQAELVPSGVGHEPKKAAEPATIVPAGESAAEVPPGEASSRKAPALRPKPTGASSKVAAGKRRVGSTKAAPSQRGQRVRGAAVKHQKSKHWP